MSRRVAPAVALVALVLAVAALVAGCGGGGTTTIVRTVTERIEVPAKGGGGSDGQEGAAAKKAATQKAAEEAQQPKRVLHLRTFRTPSGNIGCAMYQGGARCDIRKRDWKPLPRPAKCPQQVGYGQGLEVAARGEAGFVCAGDTALDPTASSLTYDTASRVGGSECISRTDGVTCVNQSGHGFFISIQSYQVF
ncbi:MAG TPA: DUF6636 domain-containing protein [Solirubrobacterales bacterium]|nr:DUF6636 domain-containing protein [Solirubrobacterales bacterium]